MKKNSASPRPKSERSLKNVPTQCMSHINQGEENLFQVPSLAEIKNDHMFSLYVQFMINVHLEI